MSLAVWMPTGARPSFVEALRAALDPAVALDTAPERPDPARYEVLVKGRPEAADLDASEALRTLVVPWAGLPVTTRDLLLERPRLAVHNLHHNAASTAEMAVGLLLAATRRLVPADRDLRRGDWSIRYADVGGMRLAGSTALVLGYGAIGRRVARALVALGVRVRATRRGAAEASVDDGVELHPSEALEGLLPASDVVVVCVPSTDETRGLLDARRLAALPAGAVLVNVARGDVVDEDALFEALRDGHLAAAGLDVWYRYPEDAEARASTMPAHRPFHELDQVVLSPHRAGLDAGTEDARARALAEVLGCLARGEPAPNAVRVDRGY